MADYNETVFSCAREQDVPLAYNKIHTELSPEISKQVKEIMLDYLKRFGLNGVFDRMNNRSISQILADYEPGQAKCIASGEKEGIRYEVFGHQ